MNRYRLIPEENRWKLTHHGDGAVLYFDTKEDALLGCAEYMIRHPGSLRIHHRDSTFAEERTSPHSASRSLAPLAPETERALTALEDARQELATEEGLVVVNPDDPEETFPLNHERVIRRIDKALEPFAGQYDSTIDTSEGQ